LPNKVFLTRSTLPESLPVADNPPGRVIIARNARHATQRNTIVPSIALILLNCSWRDGYASVAIAERIVLARKVQQRKPLETAKIGGLIIVHCFSPITFCGQLGNHATGVLTFFVYD
jgi:hypothetical protein